MIKINFDAAHNPMIPSFVLANKSGNKINGIKAHNISVSDSNTPEFSFEVYKYIDGVKNPMWDKIKDFKLVWCKEWDMWFEIKVEMDESDNTIKYVYGTNLGVAELSQINLYNVQINTEEDIERDDYKPTVIFDVDNPKASLLHRILEKAEHYSIAHVDKSIAKLQRTFDFDDISIYDAFMDIQDEIGCLFIFNSNSDENGKIQRTISVYDLQSVCNDCGHRGEFTSVCPECGSTNIYEGYGEDTTIFITSDELADTIHFTSDTDSTKNCFKLAGGDDLMTATIRNCNPNGSDYKWYITDDMKEDMSDELVEKLNSYDTEYQYYYKDYISEISEETLDKYNELVRKYQVYNKDLEEISLPIKGFSALMQAYYNTINLSVYLEHSLMPTTDLDDTDAAVQAALLTAKNLSPIAVTNLRTLSLATADNAVLGMARVIVDERYQIKVNQSSLTDSSWKGNFVVTNYSDEEDTAISSEVTLTVTDNYESYVKQRIQKMLAKNKINDMSITGLFDLPYEDFCNEIKKYSLNGLTSLTNSCQSCIDILIEQGIADNITWSGGDPNLYDDLYMPYYNKLQALQAETKVRQDELNIITGTYDADNNVVVQGLQSEIISIKEMIQDTLDFQKYLGKDLWLEFCTYRREDKYENENYISDGLNDDELFKRAIEFIQTADNEIYKSAELQHSISTTLNNLLVKKKFHPLLDHFAVWNWMRIRIDDKVYKLRLLQYEISYDNIESISVEFSDVTKIKNGITDTEDILSRAKSMGTSYDHVQRQASKGEKSDSTLRSWSEKGLDATNTKIVGNADNQNQIWDEHGMLFRKYDDIADSYEDEQTKAINSGIYITNDNWKTTKTAVGGYYYFDPVTKELKYAYGVNGEVIVGKVILGENLGIYSDNNSLTFDKNGLNITDGVNTFAVNPNISNLFKISKQDDDILWCDTSGNLNIVGTLNSSVINSSTINASSMTSSNITASTISSTTVTASNINSSTFVGGEIRSANYVSESAGSKLNLTDGSFDSAYLKWDKQGKITASDVNITGGNIIIHAKSLSDTSHRIGIEYYTDDDPQGERYNATLWPSALSIAYNEGHAMSQQGSSALYGFDGMTIYSSEFGFGLELSSTGFYVNYFNDNNYINVLKLLSHENINLDHNKLINWNNQARVYSTSNQHLYFAGSNEANYFVHLGVHDGVWTLDPDVNGMLDLGTWNHRWAQVYATSGQIQTSDRNLKNEITPISEKYIQLFNMLKPSTFKFTYGTSDRRHIGFVSQDVENALDSLGMSHKDFAGFCKDARTELCKEEYEEEETYFDFSTGETKTRIVKREHDVEYPVLDENGNQEYIYSLRYEEFIALNTKMIQLLMERVSYLENKLLSM